MKTQSNETIDQYCERIFKNVNDQELISRINSAPDFGWDDEGYELERRKNKGLRVKMQGDTLAIINK